MQRWITFGVSALLLVVAIGCGRSGGGRATDSGTMTIEEYEKQAAEAEKRMGETPQEGQ